jgi:hypothetical protein
LTLIVRLESTEKEAFQDAAALADVSLSTWVREQLRQVAIRELQSAAQPVAFLKHVSHNELCIYTLTYSPQKIYSLPANSAGELTK